MGQERALRREECGVRGTGGPGEGRAEGLAEGSAGAGAQPSSGGRWPVGGPRGPMVPRQPCWPQGTPRVAASSWHPGLLLRLAGGAAGPPLLEKQGEPLPVVLAGVWGAGSAPQR